MKTALPITWQMARIGQVCDLNPRVNIDADAEGDVTFIPMSAIDEFMGEITTPESCDIEDVRTGYTRFRENDVLFAKITPCMQNGKAAIARSLINGQGFGSTEFHVLRAGSHVLPEWLFCYVRSSVFRERAEAAFTGSAGQQRVPSGFLESAPIPLPPLSEQRRIVAILDQARSVRRLRQQAEDLTNQLIPAIFHDMFGDPIGGIPSNKRTPIRNFVEEMQGGKSLGEDPSGTRHRVVKVSAVTWGRFQPDESKFISDDYEPPTDHYVKAGDLLFSRANTNELVGATVLVTERPANVLLSDKIWRFVWKEPNRVEPLYMLALFQHPSVRWEMGNLATGTGGSMKNISKGKLLSMRVKLASHDRQKVFAQRVKDIGTLHVDASVDKALSASLLAHAFSGELTAVWRAAHREILAQEAAERDAALKKLGMTSAKPALPVILDELPTTGRYTQLSREQRELLRQTRQAVYDGEFGPSFTISSMRDWLDQPLDSLPDDAIRRHLEVLVARGLVKLVSRALGEGSGASTSKGTRYGNVYRLVREQANEDEEPELVRMAELSRMANEGRTINISVSDELKLSESLDDAGSDTNLETGD